MEISAMLSEWNAERARLETKIREIEEELQRVSKENESLRRQVSALDIQLDATIGREFGARRKLALVRKALQGGDT